MPSALDSGQCRAAKQAQNIVELSWLTIMEATHGRRNQTEDPGTVGPTSNHDGCDAAAGWLATGNDCRLCERRPDPIFSLRAGQSEGKKPGARCSALADDRSRHGGFDGDHRPVDGSTRAC